MKNKMTATGEMKIASEEDLLTLDASTSENIYRPFTPEDFRDFETETIHVREVAQRAIDETQWDTGEPGAFFKVLQLYPESAAGELPQSAQEASRQGLRHPLQHLRCAGGATVAPTEPHAYGVCGLGEEDSN